MQGAHNRKNKTQRLRFVVVKVTHAMQTSLEVEVYGMRADTPIDKLQQIF